MIKFFPLDIYEIGEVESYLHDMAAKGYILTDILFFAHYKKSEPKKITYRLEPIMKEEDGPSDAMLESYFQYGWHYICTASRQFYIFASYDDDPIELHTEPIVQSYSFAYLEKKWKITNIVGIVGLVVFLCVIIWSVTTHKYRASIYIKSDTLIWNIFLIFILVYGTIVDVKHNARIKKLLDNLKEGVPIKHRVPYKKRYENTIMIAAFVFMYASRIFITLYSVNASWYNYFDNYDTVLPTIMLDEIDDGNVDISKGELNYNGEDHNNFISHEWSELAPEMLEIDQESLVEGKMWDDGSGEYSPNISTKYYELRFKFLRDALVKDLIEYDSEIYKYKEITSEEILDTDFDYAYFVRENEMQYLYAYKDNRVVAIKYQGYGDLKKHISDIEERVEDFEEAGER